MTMQVESLEVLEKADVAPAQARAIIRAIEIEIAGAKDTLATKHDIVGLKQDMAALKQDTVALKQDTAGLKQDTVALKQDTAGLKQDTVALKQDIVALKQDTVALKQDIVALKQDTVALKQDIVALKHELLQEIAELRGETKAEIHAAVSGATRQMYMAILGQMSVLLGFAYFFATHMR